MVAEQRAAVRAEGRKRIGIQAYPAEGRVPNNYLLIEERAGIRQIDKVDSQTTPLRSEERP